LNYFFSKNHLYSLSKFPKSFSAVNNIKINFYLSPLLKKNNFIHAFFTKESSKIDIASQGGELIRNKNRNCIIKQIHSNNIAFANELNSQRIVNADGLICDHKNQNLWIYTADCMPILFADKDKRRIAAIHCGRKGLEKNIISNAIKIFVNRGSSKSNILVAIGPSISGDNYLLDKKTVLKCFSSFNRSLKEMNENINILKNLNDCASIPLDIKKHAYSELLMEGIDPNNIDLSDKCTYSLPHEFHSWRRSKNAKRQWSVICS